ncbi:MAG: phosphoribosylanthranilate isomerase, partial [Bacteroidota bacterium]
MYRPRVKICCISSIEEAQLAIQFGADALGLVGKMPSGPGPISDELIAEIIKTIGPPIASFLLTSETNANAIVAHQKKVNANTIQIVDALKEGTYDAIKKALPNVYIVQVIHVIDTHSIEEAKQIAKHVDAILLDSGNPNKAVKELGGTGRTHNWDLSKAIVESVHVPVFLAGGLNSTNVVEAIHKVKPYGVDLCSSVRTNGK